MNPTNLTFLLTFYLFQDSDSSIEKLKKQLDSLISDKELITSQITRKCDEIELLNQKINMMQLALDRSKIESVALQF